MLHPLLLHCLDIQSMSVLSIYAVRIKESGIVTLISMLLVDCINMVLVKSHLAQFMASERMEWWWFATEEQHLHAVWSIDYSQDCLASCKSVVGLEDLHAPGWAEDRTSSHPAQGTELSA